MYVVYIIKWSSAHAPGASVVWHHSLPLMNGFNKTEAAVFFVQAMLPEGFPFLQFYTVQGLLVSLFLLIYSDMINKTSSFYA